MTILRGGIAISPHFTTEQQRDLGSCPQLSEGWRWDLKPDRLIPQPACGASTLATSCPRGIPAGPRKGVGAGVGGAEGGTSGGGPQFHRTQLHVHD